MVADIPPPMTPRQMIRLLDKLCEVGCAARRKKRDGQVIYSLSLDDIWEGDAILSGEFWEQAPLPH
jgi:hypothetical protein